MDVTQLSLLSSVTSHSHGISTCIKGKLKINVYNVQWHIVNIDFELN